jgi:hypothetical protein
VEAPGARTVDSLSVGLGSDGEGCGELLVGDGAQMEGLESSSEQRWAGKAVDFGTVLDVARTWTTERCLRRQGLRVLR